VSIRDEHDPHYQEDIKILHSMGLCAGTIPPHGRLSEFRNFILDHLHPGRRHNGVSFVAQRCRRCIARYWMADCVGLRADRGHLARASRLRVPTAGGIYHWSSILGGRGWGWAAAWFNLLGLLFVVSSVNFGVYLLFRDLFVANVLGIDVSGWGWWTQTLFITGITITQALFNHYGIRTTTILTDLADI
jgi:hypothetical protein